MTQEQLLACLDADSHRLCRDAMPHVPDAPGLAAAEIRRLQAENENLKGRLGKPGSARTSLDVGGEVLELRSIDTI